MATLDCTEPDPIRVLLAELRAAADHETGRRLVIAPDGAGRWRLEWAAPDYSGMQWHDCMPALGWPVAGWIAEGIASVAEALDRAVAVQAAVMRGDPILRDRDPAVALPVVIESLPGPCMADRLRAVYRRVDEMQPPDRLMAQMAWIAATGTDQWPSSERMQASDLADLEVQAPAPCWTRCRQHARRRSLSPRRTTTIACSGTWSMSWWRWRAIRAR